ncbi:MAG: glycosyltransferase family 2 protein, partial [Phycisphaerales bacterium]|nr:glycosyltransferase family 2 protein [Phycisphaerales bacterium]
MPRILIISPCRDEQDHIRACIDSVAAQTVRPTLWIIVDDGSTDRTPEILEGAAREYGFIRVVRRDNRGQRSVGPGVIEAFYAGLDAAAPPGPAGDRDLSAFDFLGKFDADLELPPTYFQRCLDEFDRDPCLGNFSGKVYLRDDDGTLTPERMGDENAIGAAKLYRTTCFNDIAGFVRHVGWDGIDGHMCR